MSYLSDLQARQTAVAAEIRAISTAAAGGLPNASGEGLNVDHQGYKRGLYDELKTLNDLIYQAELEGGGGVDAGIVLSEEYS